MGSENPEDFGSVVILTEDDQQEIGGLINSDGEEVDFSDLSELKKKQQQKLTTDKKNRN